jgi:hypothetical protein
MITAASGRPMPNDPPIIKTSAKSKPIPARMPHISFAAARLSGLNLLDKAHGVDSSAVLSIAKCSRHTRRIPPCDTTIQYFTAF